ncbi:MAG: TetR/AcrR family transcriptional regulator [Acidimicrobiales bacterium]
MDVSEHTRLGAIGLSQLIGSGQVSILSLYDRSIANIEAMERQTGTAERVEAAALRLFASRGFEGTGIRSIADEAGISIASLYHYMGTKEDLLARLMQKSMHNLLGPAEAVEHESTDPREAIERLVDLHVRRHAEDNLLSIVGDNEIRSLTEARRREMVSLRDAYEGIWERTIGVGANQQIFVVQDVKLATLALLEMCTGVAYWYARGGRLSLDAVSKGFVEMALNLLGSTTSGRREPRPHLGSKTPERDRGRRGGT